MPGGQTCRCKGSTADLFSGSNKTVYFQICQFQGLLLFHIGPPLGVSICHIGIHPNIEPSTAGIQDNRVPYCALSEMAWLHV